MKGMIETMVERQFLFPPLQAKRVAFQVLHKRTVSSYG
jgi:hypothetical protein